MSEAAQESADADTEESTDEEEFTYYPQVTQHPHTIIEGDIVDIVTGSNLGSDVEDTGSSFGVVFEEPTVEKGSLWQNRNIPEGFDSASECNDLLRVAINGTDLDYIRGREVTEELVEEARERTADYVDEHSDADDFEDVDYDAISISGSDFKVADESDQEAEVQEVDGTVLGIDVGGGVFSSEKVDDFESDRIMVWYGGMAGQFVGRALDFNGRPFARFTENDYLLKGLYQAPIGWRGEADIEEYDEVESTDRSKLATDLGRPPRVARPPLLRDDIDGRAAIEIGRYNGGRMHEVTTMRAADDYEAYLDGEEDADELDMKYDQSPEERLEAEFGDIGNAYSLYHGDGWQDEPTDVELGSSSGDGGSFDVEVDVDDDDVSHPTDEEESFANTVVEKIAGTGVSPEDDIFPVDDGKTNLEGLVGANSGQFSVTPDVDAIRELVYANTEHLSKDDL